MTPAFRICLFAAGLALSLDAPAQQGDPDSPRLPCGRFQATWTQAQKDEHAALLEWTNARDKKGEGKAAQVRAEKKLKDAWQRERTEGSRSVQPKTGCGPKPTTAAGR